MFLKSRSKARDRYGNERSFSKSDLALMGNYAEQALVFLYFPRQRRHQRVPSLRSEQKQKISRRTCPRLNLSHYLGEGVYDALRRGRMLKSRTCASRLERCMESSLSRH